MEYYITSEQGPVGPLTIQQLKQRNIKAEDLVWCNGMTEWTPAGKVEELAELFKSAQLPPQFNRDRFEGKPEREYLHAPAEDCPPTYRWLAIIAFLGIVPCAIVALIKSVMVTRLWEEGNYEGAHKQSRQALIWGVIGAAIGIPLSIYMMFFSDGGFTSISQELMNSL